jgi:DNA-binding transcriptional ArsR family regulator
MTPKNPKPTYVINDLETLKVVADPLRSQVLELLIGKPMTVSDAAAKLGLAAGKLYYHFNMLEKHGMILVEETRVVGNLLEKVYRAAATRLEVHPDLLNFATPGGQETVNAMALAMLDTTREDLLRSLQARAFVLEQGAPPHPRGAILNRITATLSEAQANSFHTRLRALIEEMEAEDQAETGESSEDAHPYSLMIAFYPSFFYPTQEG